MSNPGRKNIFPFLQPLFLWGLFFLYVFTATRYINYPGLHYDELAFTNAALGIIDNTFIVERIGNFPVYICTYIGALKAYLYYPIFSLFGVSVMSIRLPMILLTATSMFVLFYAVNAAFGRKTAWVALILLMVCPSIMAHTRTDNGPPAISYFLSTLCFYFVLKFYTTRKTAFLAVLYCTCWVGIYYNIKFIWFINSLFFALPFLYIETIRQKIKSKEVGVLCKRFFFGMMAYFPFFIYMLIISRQYPLTAKSLLGTRKLENLINVIQGDAYYDFALGAIKTPMENQYLLLVIFLLFAGTLTVFLSRSGGRPLKHKLLFFWVLLLTTCLQVYITPQAKQPWHAFKIYPAFSIMLAVCIVAMGDRLRNVRAQYGPVFMAVVLALLVGYNTMVIGKYIAAYRDKKSRPYWSEVVYDVIDYTRKENGRFFSSCWGIHTQLLTFHQDPYRFQEIVLLLNRDMTEQEQKQFYAVYLKEHNTSNYFIVRPAGQTMYKKSLENLFKIAYKYGIKLIEHRRFHDTSDNQDIFIIYRIQ
jgi:hypothetical protein